MKNFNILGIALFFVSFFSPGVFALYANVTKVYPNIIENGTDTIYNICLFNENPSIYLYDISISFSTPACIGLDNKEIRIDKLESSYCFSVKFRIGNCEEGFYTVLMKVEYYKNFTRFEYSYPIFIPVIKKPELVINKIFYYNNFAGEIAKVNIDLVNRGGEAKDVYIRFNSTNCLLNNPEVYINSIKNEFKVNLDVEIPEIVTGYCIIFMNILYKDLMSNVYTDIKLISIPIYVLEGRLILNYDNILLSPNEEKTVYIELVNEGAKTFYNVLLKFMNIPNINFKNTEIFIDQISAGSRKKIPVTIYVDKDISGVISVPVTIIYTDKFGKIYNSTQYLLIKVSGKPEIILSLRKVDKDKIEFAVYNLGESTAYGIYIKANCLEGCKLSKQIEFIGELEKNDWTVVTFNFLSVKNNFTIEINFSYKDEFGNVYEDSFVKYVFLYNENKNKYLPYILILIVMLLGLLFYLRIKK